jgi:hypothetical protein
MRPKLVSSMNTRPHNGRQSIVKGGPVMFHAVTWIAVLSLLALWSLAAWALHAAAVWTVSHAGAVTGVASGVGGLRLPDGLAPWVPPEIAQAMTALLSGLARVVESLLQAAPALAGGLTVAAWVIWGLGSVLLLLLGAGLHLLVALWRRRGPGAAHARRPGHEKPAAAGTA